MRQTISTIDLQENVVLLLGQSLCHPSAGNIFEKKLENFSEMSLFFIEKGKLMKVKWKPPKRAIQCLFYIRMKKEASISESNNSRVFLSTFSYGRFLSKD